MVNDNANVRQCVNEDNANLSLEKSLGDPVLDFLHLAFCVLVREKINEIGNKKLKKWKSRKRVL